MTTTDHTGVTTEGADRATARMYYDEDASLDMLTGKTVAVIGYGSQGHAHARNLAESGVSVIVGLYEGSKSATKAREDGLEVASVADASARADLVMILVPDERQRELYLNDIKPNMRPGEALFFAHGFNVHYGQVEAPDDVDVCMVAPKGPGHLVRRTFTEGNGVPALFAVDQDATGNARALALAYAKAIGAARAGVIETTFREETETDLFGEQAVLCGGLSQLIQAGFETLTDAGYQPEVVYFECLHEVKLIVDLLYEGGIARMRYSVSDTAEYGDYYSGSYIVDEDTRARMRNVLEKVQNGAFARDWILENQTNRPFFNAERRRQAEHEVEQVGARLRGMMSWLPQPED